MGSKKERGQCWLFLSRHRHAGYVILLATAGAGAVVLCVVVFPGAANGSTERVRAALTLSSTGGTSVSGATGDHSLDTVAIQRAARGVRTLVFVRIPPDVDAASMASLESMAESHWAPEERPLLLARADRAALLGPGAALDVIAGRTCERIDAPPSLLPEAYPPDGQAGAGDTFCLLRSPYDRVIAAFRQYAASAPGARDNPIACFEGLSAFVRENLQPGSAPGSSSPQATACALGLLLPQAAYVFAWRDAHVDKLGRRGCKHLLRSDHWVEDTNELLEASGYKQRLAQTLPGASPNTNAPAAFCASLSQRSFSPEARRLVEQAFADDFRLLGFRKLSWPEFIHIPRTGGTTVEDVAMRYEHWGEHHLQLQSVLEPIGTTVRSGRCYRQHIPPSLLPDIFAGRDSFCIVRDVYARLVSQFGFQMTGLGYEFKTGKGYECSVPDLNRYIVEHLSGRSRERGYPYGSDCHFLPQAAFVYGWDIQSERVDTSVRWCKHVIRFERLHEELNQLWQMYGYPMRLVKQRALGTMTKGNCSKLRGSDLNSSTRLLVQEVYREDFELLEKVEREATAIRQPSRTLIREDRYVDKNALIADDIWTAPEFELSFDIIPVAVVDVTSSILRLTTTSTHYGHFADRIPAILFMKETTRLMSYMGHQKDHNANCIAPPPGLPLGRNTKVLAQLKGTKFRIFADGSLICDVGGFDEKYEAMTGVKMYVGDNFNRHANAVIANLVYTALG